jgi:hypothetical protein
MIGMTTDTLTRKKNTGEPGNGGHFGSVTRDDAAIELDIRAGDTFAPLSAAESKVFVEDAFLQIDVALATEADADSKTDANAAAGRAHAYAEIAAIALETGTIGDSYEAAAETLIDQRQNGDEIEARDGWNGPGELDTVKRQQIVTYMRTRAQELGDAAETATDAESQAFYFARADVFADAEFDLSAKSAYYVGDDA